MRAFRLVLAALTLASCLDPTEIMVAITTNVPCNMVRGTAIAVGAAGDDSTGVATSTTMCDDTGHIGTLAVLPSGSNDDTVGIRVTLGLTVSPDVCVAPKFSGCIVARRALRYGPHHRLDLPIELDQDCANVACDPTSSCVQGGCTDAGVECDDAGTCTLPPLDAGAVDAGPQIACDTPMLVVPSAPAVRPHLAKMNSGYALAWDNGAGVSGHKAVVETFDGSGVTSGPSTMIALSPNGAVGPFASDGVGYALLTTDTTFDITYAEPSQVAATQSIAGAMTTLPSAGLVYASSHFSFLSLGSAESSFSLDAFTPPNTLISQGFGAIGMSPSFSLDLNPTNFYVADFGSNCTLTSYDTSTRSLLSGRSLFTGGCNLVLVAGNGAAEAALAQAGSQLQLDAFDGSNLGPTGNAVLGPTDANSFVLMASGVGFRVVHAMGGVIASDTFNAMAVSAGSVPIISTASATSVTWDAVTDGPLQTSYGVVWWSTTPSTGFWFERFCK